MRDHALADRGCFDFAEFEGQSGGYVRLLPHGLTDEKLTCLAVVVREAFSTQTAFGALFDVREWCETALRRLAWSFAEGVRLIIGASDRISHGHMSVLLKVG